MAIFAPALARLRSELNKRWPNRDRTTDGWIGDTAHQSSGSPENGGSDHNPNKRGVVDAYDIDVDGIDCPAVVAKAIKNPATNYVIWARKIWSRLHGFASRAYTGSNPHDDHIHVSLLQTVAAENSTTPWGIADVAESTTVPVVKPGVPAPAGWAATLIANLPVLQYLPSAVRSSAMKAQALLNADGADLQTDGIFGQKTLEQVKAFQVRSGLVDDGVIGPKTWSALIGDMPTLRSGAAGDPVRRAQWLLNVFGRNLKVDGQYGPLTMGGVRVTQAYFGLDQDDIVGPDTWTALLTRSPW